MALAKVPVIVGGVCGGTDGNGPFAEIMRFAKAHEGRNGVLSTSVFLVHPYLDLPDMGGGGLVITDNDPDTAVALARQMYESRDFSAMPILADALQDAGCDNEDILSHCRSDGPHVRGCWVVDLVLGKE